MEISTNISLSEISNRNDILLEINDQERILNNKKSRLMELYLDTKISQIEFDKKNNDLEVQLDYVRTRREDLDKDIGKFYGILKDCLKIADSSYIFFKSSSNVNDKSLLIRFICSNCEIEEKNIVISMKKAFEMISSKDFRLNWLAAIEQLRTTYRLDVLSLNESIQKIKSTNILQ